jgi:hypothetical protein
MLRLAGFVASFVLSYPCQDFPPVLAVGKPVGGAITADLPPLAGRDVERRFGEGLLGLRRAFAEAGVRTVISTLWRVRDDATRAWSERFYRGLWEENLSAAQALRAAQLWLLRGGSEGAWRLPCHWAAWVVAGDRR